MPEHVHVHPPEELAEPSEANDRRERRFELLAVLLMSIATVGIAWSGYQAASWSGEQEQRYAQSNSEHERATRTGSLGSQERLEDLEDFNHWLEATAMGNTALAAMYERRFRDEFRPAFRAWLAQRPFERDDAAPSPLFVREYHDAHEERAMALEHLAALHYEAGKDATENADDYVFVTVLMAAVLFFGGISLRFTWNRARIGVLAVGSVFLVIGLIEIAGLPTH
jgi:hypothetical protein